MNFKQMMYYVTERNYSYKQNNNEPRRTAHRIKPFMIDRIVVNASC
jgi:hypothetical protein